MFQNPSRKDGWTNLKNNYKREGRFWSLSLFFFFYWEMNDRDVHLSSNSLPFLSPVVPYYLSFLSQYPTHILLTPTTPTFVLWTAGKEIISALPGEQVTNENHPHAGFLLIINHEDVTVKLFAHTHTQHCPNCFHAAFIDRKSSGHHNRTVHGHFLCVCARLCCLGACTRLFPKGI